MPPNTSDTPPFQGSLFNVLQTTDGYPLLLADGSPDGSWRPWREATLGALGKKRNVLVGTNWGGSNCTADDFLRIDINLRREFALIALYAAMTSVEPQEGVFNLFFANTADEAYRNQMPILVGPLVYYSGSADWIKQLPRAQMIDAMNGYIKLIMGEIKKLKVVGRPIYKVGNEAYDNNNFLMQTIGPEYIDMHSRRPETRTLRLF